MSKTQRRLMAGRLLAVLPVVVSGAVLGACVETPPAPAASADLTVSVSIDDASPYYGQEVVLTTVVENLGADTATGVSVTLSLPAGLGYVDPSSGDPSESVSWPVGQLAAGTDATLALHVNGGDVVLGDQVVSATVESTTWDPAAGNNIDSLTEHSVPAPWVPTIVPDPTNPTLVDIGASGSIGWSASVASEVGPSAPAPPRALMDFFWSCETVSADPCPFVNELTHGNFDSLAFAVDTLQIDTYIITLTVTPSDPNFDPIPGSTSVQFVTTNSGGN